MTPTSVPGLLWDLAMREFQRMGPQMGKPVTDFAGQTRFLRALCAAVPFNSITPSGEPWSPAICRAAARAATRRDPPRFEHHDQPAADHPALDQRRRHQRRLPRPRRGAKDGGPALGSV